VAGKWLLLIKKEEEVDDCITCTAFQLFGLAE
jgi:hypothetical protein